MQIIKKTFLVNELIPSLFENEYTIIITIINGDVNFLKLNFFILLYPQKLVYSILIPVPNNIKYQLSGLDPTKPIRIILQKILLNQQKFYRYIYCYYI